jgi:predicted Zn finger-like uncharacterized protein
MLIACPNCSTSYDIEPSSLGRTGRSVRCVRCRQVWFATDPGVLSAVAQGYREDVDTTSSQEAMPAAAAAEASLPPSNQADPPPGAAGAAPEPLSSLPEAQAWEAAPEPPSAAMDIDHAPPLAGDPPAAPAPEAAEPAEAPVVADAPAIVPALPGETAPPLALSAPEPRAADIESVAARRRPQRGGRKVRRTPPLGWPVLILALVALNAALIKWRTEVVRYLPQTASLYAALRLPVNLRGLEFVDVATEAEVQDGVTVLVIEGTIASTVGRPVDVPRLRFAVRNDRGQEIYSWTAQPPKTVLAPGATVTFRSRLASPPPEARAVLVRFQNRRDFGAPPL